MNIKYCHECSEQTLKYYLALKGHRPPITSDVSNECFYTLANAVNYTISIKDLSVKFNEELHKFPDLNTFILFIIRKIYG